MIDLYCFIIPNQSCSKFHIKNVSSKISHKTKVCHYFWRIMVTLAISFNSYNMIFRHKNISSRRTLRLSQKNLDLTVSDKVIDEQMKIRKNIDNEKI